MRPFIALSMVLALGLLHCGPSIPVSATVVSCADRTPIANAQVDHIGEVSRTGADGTWSSSVQGGGSLPVEVYHTGFKGKKVALKSGPEGQTVCLTPDT